MAHVKAIGAGKYGKDSRPKYRGVKLHDGQPAEPGNIIVRQTGTSITAGPGVRTGSDYTLYAGRGGIVRYRVVRKQNYDGSRRQATVVSVVAAK